ncbi:ABC transporter ATP-binding protein [Planctomycetaceae bacterium SH139]
MSEVLVDVEHVSKRYCRDLKRSLWYGVRDLASEFAGQSASDSELRPGEFWAVDDVSFQLRRGECLGLIGPNGAGKSTLLKMLNGLIKPDSGRVRIRGRVGALIELGAGFHPVLTGRENIYVNGSILGMSKREIEHQLDEIIDFAEIGDAIDAPVQTYSSGMKVRLGFAIASEMRPDVLIIDEVLAVGDAGFRTKCYNKISQLMQDTAVIFVSHSMPHVSRLADRTIVLQGGSCTFQGVTPEAINAYYSVFDIDEQGRRGTGEARITSFECFRTDDISTTAFQFAESLTVRLGISANQTINSLVVDIYFSTVSGERIAECNNFVIPTKLSILAGKSIVVEARIPQLTLNPGVYRMGALLMCENMNAHYDWLPAIEKITVEGARPATTGQQFFADWRVTDNTIDLKEVQED